MIKRESTRHSSDKWTKTLFQDYLHCIANLCATVLNILSKEIISNNTKCRKQTLKDTGKMKLRLNFFLCLHNFSEPFEIYFLEFPWEMGFGIIVFQATIYFVSF